MINNPKAFSNKEFLPQVEGLCIRFKETGLSQTFLKEHLYGMRWKVESYMSGLKRTTGSTLSARKPLIPIQICHHKAWVCALVGMFGFGDDSSSVIPCLRRAVEIGEEPDLFSGALELGFGLRLPRREPCVEPFVLSQPDDIANVVSLAPTQHPPAAEAGVATKHDLHLGPLLPQPFDQQGKNRQL